MNALENLDQLIEKKIEENHLENKNVNLNYNFPLRMIYTQYIEAFGDIKPSDLNLGLEKVYKCPNCKGKGKLHQSSSDGRGEFDYTCTVCNGTGYTDHELKPKMVQDGWE